VSSVNHSYVIQNASGPGRSYSGQTPTSIRSIPNLDGSGVFVSTLMKVDANNITNSPANNDMIFFLSDIQDGFPSSGFYADNNKFAVFSQNPFSTGWFSMSNAFSNAGSNIFVNVVCDFPCLFSSDGRFSGLTNTINTILFNA
jgi:hypothetical protein